MNTLNMFISIGVCDQQPEYLQHKIKLSNKVVLLLLSLVIFYGILFYLKLPQLSWIMVVCGAIFTSILLLNHWGLHLGARLTLSLLPQILVVCVHALLIQVDEPLLISMIVYNVALFILPWMLFDLREYPFIIIATLLSITPIIGFDVMNEWLEFPVDASFFRNKKFEIASILIAVSIICLGLYFFQDQGLKSEKRFEQIVGELNAKNKKFEASETDTQKYIQQIEENQQEEKKRGWASEGLAKFATILRATDDFQKMYDTVISELVKYMGANQGGLYTVENSDDAENMHIRLASCYAYGGKKFLEQDIQIGQGLIGQAYLEKAPIYMTHVPENYVRITSGLGQATPRSILIMPLIVNDRVEGLVELASFEMFQAYQISFLKNLGESIASTIANNRINIKTRHLLEETQQQGEVMRAQEEEMLSKTIEVESRLNAIDESGIASVEFDLKGNIILANANFLAMMDYRWEEIRGKHHRMFVSNTYAQGKEYEQFWHNLNKGIPQMGEYERLGKNGKRVFIQGSYSIMRDVKGHPIGVVKLAANITAIKLAQQELHHQTEELQAQEEELRQNLEEMQAIQEEMLRKTIEMESRLTAIDESGIASVEFDLKGNIIIANANFLSMMGYKWEEIQGKHHCMFVSDAYAQGEEYKQFWHNLSMGIPQIGEYERLSKNGKPVFIQGSYSILRDAQGHPTGVVKLATDITATKLTQKEIIHSLAKS